MWSLLYRTARFRSGLLSCVLLAVAATSASADDVLYIRDSGHARGGFIEASTTEIQFKVGCRPRDEGQPGAVYDLERVSSITIGDECPKRWFTPFRTLYNYTARPVVNWISRPADPREGAIAVTLPSSDASILCAASRGQTYLWRVVPERGEDVVAARIQLGEQQLIGDARVWPRRDLRRVQPIPREPLCGELDAAQAAAEAQDQSQDAIVARATESATTPATPP